WSTTKLGARVLVVQDEVTPMEITHPNLFKPAADVHAAEQISRVQTAAATMSDAISAATVDPPSGGNADSEGMTRDFARRTIPALDLPKWSELPTLDAPVRARDATKLEAREGPVSVFVSRQEGKLYVRQDFEAVFEVPITVREPGRLIG